MKEEIAQLQLDLENTEKELIGLVKTRKNLYWFMIAGVLLAPLGILWHFILCFVIFGLFGVLFATSSYITYGHTKNLNYRRNHLVQRLNELGQTTEFI